MERLVDTMLLSNQAAAELVGEFDIKALTDVTGFGLAGHLLEMLHASNTAAELRLQSIPLLPGVAELFEQNIQSTLAPANRASEKEIAISEANRRSVAYNVLFDPQTSGGLLLGVPERFVARVLERLGQQSSIRAALIGRVKAPTDEKPVICCI